MDFTMEDDFFSSSTDDAAWNNTRDTEWSKISNEFTNTGYREGITAGKEGAVQSGFDAGFADVGVPLGRYVGLLRGYTSALLSFLLASTFPAERESNRETAIQTARDIQQLLNEIRYSDIEPIDEEAERHAREHLEAEDEDAMDGTIPEELKEKRKLEKLEDMLAGVSTADSTSSSTRPRPTIEDVDRLKDRLWPLFKEVNLAVPEINTWRL